MIDFHNFLGPGAAAGAFGVEIGTRHTALLIEPGDHGIPGNQPLLANRHPQRPAGLCFLGVEAVEQKVAQAVDDQMTFVVLGPLRDVRMGADNNVGPGSRSFSLRTFFRAHWPVRLPGPSACTESPCRLCISRGPLSSRRPLLLHARSRQRRLLFRRPEMIAIILHNSRASRYARRYDR